MKTRTKEMETVKELPSKKVVRVDNEIQVLVSELSSSFVENDIWPASVENAQLPDSGWLENGPSLILVGNRHTLPCTPTKWDNPVILPSRNVRQLKENLTPLKSRKVASPMKCSLKFSHEHLLNQSSASSQQPPYVRLKEASDSSTLNCNGKISNKSKPPSPVKHIVESPTKCFESWQTLQQAEYANSATNVPSPTEGAVAPDTGGNNAAAYPALDSSITSTKCSLRKQNIAKNCDVVEPRRPRLRGKTRIAKKRGSREMKQLYVSLKEIPWAQHWSPKTFLTRNKKHASRTSRKKVLNAKLSDADKNKPSSIYAKFYPPKKNAKSEKIILASDPSVVDAIAKKRMKRELNRLIVNGEARMTVPIVNSDAVVSSNTVENTHKENGPVSVRKYTKERTAAAQTIKKPVQPYALPKPLPVSPNLTIKVETPAESQRTKSSTVRFDFVSKSKKAHISVAATPEDSALQAMPTCPVVIKKENCGLDKPKVSKVVDGACIAKGKCTVKCVDSQKCCQDANCHGDGIGILGTIFQRKEGSRKRKLEEDMLRSSVRQSECAFRYKEIAVKKHNNYIQIILVPNSVRRNTLSLEALKELKEAFLSAQKDPTCKVVLLNSSGKYFCTGLDLLPLLGTDKDKFASILAETLKSLVETLALFSKPLVAAVNGKAVGLGVSLLPFCDVVLASDKATFFTPYAKLGYIPEAAATLTMPQVMGSTWAMNMLLRSQKLTAIQAHSCGLVTEVLWPSKFMEEVIPRVQDMASQSLQVMEATKVMMRCHQWEKLQAVLQTESRLLSKQWLTPQCQKSIREMLDRRLCT